MAKIDELVVQIKADTKQLRKGLSKSQQQMKGFAKTSKASFAGLGAAVAKAKVMLIAMGTILAGLAFRAVAKDVMEFNKAVGEVSTLVDSAKVSTELLGKTVRNLSAQFGTEFTVQAKALYQAISSGAVTATNATELLTSANKLAVGGVTSVAIAVDGLTNIINSFKMQASDSTRIADIFFSTVKDAKTTVGELAMAMGQVTPIAASVGVSFNEVAAAVGTITLAGVTTSEAVTQLRGALVAVAKQTPQAARVAKQLGVDFSLTALQAKGLRKFFDDIVVAAGGNVEVLTKLMGRVEGLQGVLNITGKNSAVFARLLDNNANSAGMADKAFEKMAETMSFKLNVAMTELRAIGLALSPMISGLIDLFGKLFKAVNAVSEAFNILGFRSTYANEIAKVQKATNLGLVDSIKKIRDALALASDKNIRLEQALELVIRAIKESTASGFPYEAVLKRLTRETHKFVEINKKLGAIKIFQPDDLIILNKELIKSINLTGLFFPKAAAAGWALSQVAEIGEKLGLSPKDAAEAFAKALDKVKFNTIFTGRALRQMLEEGRLGNEPLQAAIEKTITVMKKQRKEEHLRRLAAEAGREKEIEGILKVAAERERIDRAKALDEPIEKSQARIDLEQVRLDLIKQRGELLGKYTQKEIEQIEARIDADLRLLDVVLGTREVAKERVKINAEQVKILNEGIKATRTATEKATEEINKFKEARVALNNEQIARRKQLRSLEEKIKSTRKSIELDKKEQKETKKLVENLETLNKERKGLIKTIQRDKEVRLKAIDAEIKMLRKKAQIEQLDIIRRAGERYQRLKEIEDARRQFRELEREFGEVDPFRALRDGIGDAIEDFDNAAQTFYKIGQEMTLSLRDALADTFKALGRGKNIKSIWKKFWADLNNIALDMVTKMLASQIIAGLYKIILDLFGLTIGGYSELEAQLGKQVTLHAAIAAAAAASNSIQKKALKEQIELLREKNRLMQQSQQQLVGVGNALAGITSSLAGLGDGGFGFGGGGLGFGGGFGFGSLLGGLGGAISGFTTTIGDWVSGAIGIGNVFSNVGTILGFQRGGEINRGEAGIVGERGPELFVPRTGGQIIPTSQITREPEMTVVNNMNFSLGVQDTVRAELLANMPHIQQATQQGVFDAIERGGKFAKAVGRKA